MLCGIEVPFWQKENNFMEIKMSNKNEKLCIKILLVSPNYRILSDLSALWSLLVDVIPYTIFDLG